MSKMNNFSIIPFREKIGPITYLIAFIIWIFPFFFPESSWLAYLFLLFFSFSLHCIKLRIPIFKEGLKYPRLKDYSYLVQDISPLYEWEMKNHPFLSIFSGLRFAKKENPENLEDFQAVYINSKENIIYLFNLYNQEPQITLQGFMIEDLHDFYITIQIPHQKILRRHTLPHIPYMKEKTFDDLKFFLKNPQYQQQILITCIHLVFEVENSSGKRLEASLYPSNLNKIPYLIRGEDPHYISLIRKGMNIISLLERAQGRFPWGEKSEFSLNNALRLEFSEN